MADQNPYGMPPMYPQLPAQGYGDAMPPQHPGMPPPQAYPPSNYQPMTYYYYISSKINGHVLDIEGGSENSLSRVVMWPKKEVSEAANQLWYNDYTTGTIKSKLNNLCLEFKDGKVVVNTYQPGNSNQLWEGVSQVIKNRMNPNLVFEIQGGSKEPGAPLVASTYNGSPQQQFEPIFPPPPPGQQPQPLPGTLPLLPGQTVIPGQPMMPGQPVIPGQPTMPGQLPPQPSPSLPVQPTAPAFDPIPTKPPFVKKLFFLVSEMHGKVMDVEGSNANEGAGVIAYDKNKGARNQMWYLDEEGLLRSALNDFVPNASGKATPLKMVQFTGGASQRFRLDGKKIVNGVGECADIRGAWKNNGAPVITYKYSGASNQHWKVEYV